MGLKPETYTIQLGCINCYTQTNSINIPYGTSVEQWQGIDKRQTDDFKGLEDKPCAICGCKALHFNR